ncbi:dimeric dihydrodiol dehydrogenase [Naegleria gruberi]|uniref:D-xylose 1-dehydrogenase (NADP(+), D-xylono-1,5-lactone-forming) n=1 Tax=Naegleria gruberi TaxID=5762 RepID=D2VJS2_NAEGR|nr:dimeric dihydrodiol dehydrogenase [Naegleria gruberi]EFC43082.1 dimeric dihydrodiol dehydrogenase [Naegleria gruberi]|eukprot:XP_002675826.1 dimeric dihydrodiol dehydrogenase [Naegleria gruberi strain NEG-M]
MRRVSFGIMGTGRIAHDFSLAFQSMHKFHHENKSTKYETIRECRIYGVASRNSSKSDQFAKEHDIGKSFDSYEKMLQDSNIDIVYVATPNSEHYSNVKLCLESGKSVLCEKTFTLNEKQASELFEMARERKLFLMEANWMPFFPLFKKAKQLIESGEIGQVHLIHAQLGFKNNHVSNSGLIENSLGGGALLACGIYPISFVCMVMNDFSPETIQSIGTFVNNVDESVECQFKFSGNRIGKVSTSINAFLDSSATIHGSLGKIHLGGMHCCPTKLTWTNYSKGHETIELEEPLYGKTEFSQFNFPNSEGLAYEIEHVIDCLLESKLESEIVSSNVTINTLKIMDKIRSDIGLKFIGE